MQVAMSGVVVGLSLALVLFLLMRTEKLAVGLPVLSWAVPVAFGLIYAFERPLGEAFGIGLIVPFVLLPLVGIVLAIAGVALVLRRGDRPKRAVLIGAAVALTPAIAMLLSEVRS